MTSLSIGALLLYDATVTEALQLRVASETGTHGAKITDTYEPGKIYTQNFMYIMWLV